MTVVVEVKALALHTPIDLPNLTFSDSPIFTVQRRRRIQEVIDEFRTYLKDVGFDISQQVFPIETRSGKSIGMAFISPGSVYDGKLLIGEKSIDDPAVIRTAYAQYYFMTTIGDIQTSAGESGQLAMVYERYYLDSYSGKFIAPLDEELKLRDSGHEVLRENRLAHKREGMALFIGNFHETICGCISRKEQNFAFWTGSLEPGCQLDAVHLRHDHIGNQYAWATRLRSQHHLFGVSEGGRLKAGRIQDSGDSQCGSRLIVHHEDGLRVVFCHYGILPHHAWRPHEHPQSPLTR
jgi:hypothetical protein